jgi:hypothetical protein
MCIKCVTFGKVISSLMTTWKIFSVCLFSSDENVNTVSEQNSNLWIIKAAGTQISL